MKHGLVYKKTEKYAKAYQLVVPEVPAGFKVFCPTWTTWYIGKEKGIYKQLTEAEIAHCKTIRKQGVAVTAPGVVGTVGWVASTTRNVMVTWKNLTNVKGESLQDWRDPCGLLLVS